MDEKNNFIIIYQWMTSELKLKGIDLNIFSMIYSFTRNDVLFYGSIDYMANWFGVSAPTVISALKRLVDKNYIVKSLNYHAGYVDKYNYKVHSEIINKYRFIEA